MVARMPSRLYCCVASLVSAGDWAEGEGWVWVQMRRVPLAKGSEQSSRMGAIGKELGGDVQRRHLGCRIHPPPPSPA